MNAERSHYSYSIYRDETMARTFDREKFSGPIGRLILEHQETVIRTFLPSVGGLRVLDVGAGTGRTIIPLSHRGAVAYASDASPEMLSVTREKSWLQGCRVTCICADAQRLPFSDESFDAVVSFRMLMHVVDWKAALREMCRVSGRYLILDFPPKQGFAGLAPLVHPVLNALKPNHQPYRVFRLSQISRQLDEEGFRVTAIDRHLVFPFGLHRLVNNAGFTRFIENCCRKTGLTDLFGAPITILAERISQ